MTDKKRLTTDDFDPKVMRLFEPAGTQHGFHNDTTPRYDEKAAHQAWELTTALFERQLRKAR